MSQAIGQPSSLVSPGNSPSTPNADIGQALRGTKRAYYARNGVPEYWILDADTRAIERWHPSDERAERLTDTLAWRPDTHSEAFVLDVRSLTTSTEPASTNVLLTGSTRR
jgi:hypothetical protein